MTKRTRRLSAEFKLETALLVLDQNYLVTETAQAIEPKYRYRKASQEHIEIQNHLGRQFAVTAPNEV
ncbi:TPA: hypothetical protein ACX6RU_000606 [Photobacterium damselae]